MTNNLNLPLGHHLVPTEDGSFTFFSEAFQEACHSTGGARAETLVHYIQGCNILEKAKSPAPLTILEVGFGLGLGFLTTREQIPSEKKFHFISLELDRNLLEWFKDKHSEFNLVWKKNILEAEFENFKLTIIQGNARCALPDYLKYHHIKWNAIYQDAFSPKKNPAIWTKEWFSLLKDHSHSDAILSTYSSSASIRKALIETGWSVYKGEQFGKKRTSTRASLIGTSDPEIVKLLERSPVMALTDLQIEGLIIE
jgi:chorismate dehydratase